MSPETRPRLLIVEDDPKTAQFLRKGFEESGFSVRVAEDGFEGLEEARARSPRLIVLDVGLPRQDGWTMLRSLRERGDPVPVLLLTARDEISDKIKGLELGADDYLVKPFSFSELLARARTVLRRCESAATRLRVGGLVVNLIERRVERDGRHLELSPIEFSLLVLLVRNANSPVPRRLLAEQVWGMRFDSDTNVVDVAIKRLRAKVDEQFASKLIHTVRGIGYVCTAG